MSVVTVVYCYVDRPVAEQAASIAQLPKSLSAQEPKCPSAREPKCPRAQQPNNPSAQEPCPRV
jgi:hypothetical protein